MNIIKIMDKSLSNKIAAGEVVETLMNVVKELVENAIDAKANEIRIDLIDSGIKVISVTDNGCGMTKDDAISSFERHATSKIYSDDDLFNINTLGFRGEALPSIASVSKVLIKTSDGLEGTSIKIEAGKVEDIKNSDLRVGTKIEVKDIFYNTPARLKYLKSLYTEVANITSYVNKMALANPNIKFILTNDDKVILNTDGSGNLLKVINNIYGLDVTKKMCSINNANSDYSISGYISYPEISRTNRNYITILVNGRNVRNNDVLRTIIGAYHTYMPKDKYPIVVLNILVDPAIIDVNIHPTKMDIKFSKIDTLLSLIEETVGGALEKLTLIPEIKYEDRPIKNIEVLTTASKVDFMEEVTKPVFEEITFDFNVKEEEVVYERSVDTSLEKMEVIEPIGLIHGTYIVGESPKGLYIIDQHAANERINYEYYLEKLGLMTKDVVDLLIPIKIDVANNDYLILKENFNLLDELDISYEEFGDKTIIIRSHPTWIKKDFAKESIRKIIDIIVSKEKFSKEKFNENIAITLACKLSIKANDHIELNEMRELLNTLRLCKNPFTCPHGRPTVIVFTKYELEKMFKRVMS